MKVLHEGNYIKHFQYGCGVITATDRDYTLIDFDLHGPKKFVTSLMTVEQVEGTPPKRVSPKRVSAKRRKKASDAPAPMGGTSGAK